MSVFFGFLLFISFVLLVTGLIKPGLVIRWGTSRTRKEVLICYLTSFILSFILLGVVSTTVFTVQKDVEDVTTKESVTISGNADNAGLVTVNGQKCDVSDNKFKATYPLALGANEFKILYTFSSQNQSTTFNIRRTTEEALAKEKAIAEAAKEQARLAEEHKKQIEGQFSQWDGSHTKLEQLIKQGMNDPSSYEHVKTVYWDLKKHLVVSTTFRGKNAFGGLVMNTVKAKVSMDGDVLEIISQN